jgi:hypothetical protein
MSCADRRDGAVIGLARADADDALERDDEDLPVADLAGLAAVAERVDRGLASPIFTVVPR